VIVKNTDKRISQCMNARVGADGGLHIPPWRALRRRSRRPKKPSVRKPRLPWELPRRMPGHLPQHRRATQSRHNGRRTWAPHYRLAPASQPERVGAPDNGGI